MDVRCERCGTEYEFDDALVSDRGTSVKCTECQHEFRVMPSLRATQAAGGVDEWIVNRAGGAQLVFTSLRRLQEAIRSGQLAREDTVARPGRRGAAGQPRALGSISELEHLFPKTGIEGPLDASLAPMRSRVDTLRPDPVASVPPPPESDEDVAATATRAGRPGMSATSTLQIGALTDSTALYKGKAIAEEPPAALHDLASDSSMSDLDDESSPPPRSVRARASGSLASGVPISVRPARTARSWSAREELAGESAALASHEDGDAHIPGFATREHEAADRLGSRRRVGGWVVAFVLVGGAAVVGFVAARPYLLGARVQPVVATGDAPVDPRATDLAAQGERALAAGDLESARDDLGKASALAPANPRIALDRAKTAAALADIAWLRARLGSTATAPSDPQMGELAQSAETLAAAAATLSPGEAGATRARVDALRLAGKLPEARAAASPLAASSSDPETAYVLAALDAADPQPLWGTVVDRLRVAASAEGELGRARALLVYALARSGDTASAGREIEKLAASSRPHPLLTTLRAFVEAARTQVPSGAVSAAAATVPNEVDVNALPRPGNVAVPVTPVAVAGGGAGAAGKGDNGEAVGGATRKLDAQADAARNAGEYERAGKLYSQALDRNPNDSEALGGLGAVSHAKGDLEGAKASYRRALIVNPQFLPALVGLADVEWESGDKSAAEQTYHEIAQRFPEGAYPKRVKERAPESSGGSAGSGEQTGGSGSSSGSATSTPATRVPPDGSAASPAPTGAPTSSAPPAATAPTARAAAPAPVAPAPVAPAAAASSGAPSTGAPSTGGSGGSAPGESTP